MTSAIIVYYSKHCRDRLETVLVNQGIEVNSISGRSPNATNTLRLHPAELVVIDKDSADISVTQAVRRIAQISPTSWIITAGASNPKSEVYRNGSRIGVVDLKEIRQELIDSHGDIYDTSNLP